jgi:hypothetical protein
MEGKNILTRICFMAGAAILGVGGVVAAPPTPTASVKTVVKVDARTGRLVRVAVAAPGAAQRPQALEGQQPVATTTAQTGVEYGSIVERVATEQSLPPELIHSVIQVESNYNPGAVSPKGAQGLMQLMPDTARRFGVPNTFDPVENIKGGAKYLKYLLELYKGDYPRALAAYNAGEGAVAKYNGIPPYAETQSYVARVQKRIEAAKPPAPPKKAPEVKPVVTENTGPRHIQEVVGTDGSVRYVTEGLRP